MIAGLAVLGAMVGTGVALGAVPLRASGVAVMAAVAVGHRLHRRAAPPTRAGRDPWLLLAGGVAVLVVAEGALGSTGTGRLAGSTASELLALAGYPCVAAGLVGLLRGRRRARHSEILVEAGLAAIAAGLTLWAVLAPVGTRGGGMGIVRWVVPIVATSLDVGLLTIVARLLFLPGERIATYRHVAVATALLLSAHLARALSGFGAWNVAPGTIRLLLVGSFVCWGLAALDPSRKLLFEPLLEDPPAFSPGHLVLVVTAILAAPTLIAVQTQRSAAVAPVVAIGAVLLSLVMATYVGSLLWDRARTGHRAERDALTGLPNRALFQDRLNRALAHARRRRLEAAVLFVDLDRFKDVNDTFGHAAGDRLLREVARRLQGCVRDEDTVARLGGDEFALLLPHVAGFDGAVTVAERVVGAFEEPVELDGGRVVVTPSVGLTLFPDDGDDPDQLLANADAAMYRAKERGRNRFEVYSPGLQSRAQERLAIEADLRDAIAREELVLHYQPVVDLRTRQIVAVEALVRWNHPERGLLAPAEFVPVAEQTDLVIDLGDYVLAAACEQARQWQEVGLPAVRVSVNVSARQLRERLADTVAATLRASGLDAGLLQLELTETTAVGNCDLVVDVLHDLRSMGVRCAVDDFGTGYSSLGLLSRLPVDVLKIDKSFVLDPSPTNTSIASAIIALGHSLGMQVIAEGVETPSQHVLLADEGCQFAQGYLFGRPMPADDLAALLRARPAAARQPAERLAEPVLA